MHRRLGLAPGERLLDLACGAGLAMEVAAAQGREGGEGRGEHGDDGIPRRGDPGRGATMARDAAAIKGARGPPASMASS